MKNKMKPKHMYKLVKNKMKPNDPGVKLVTN